MADAHDDRRVQKSRDLLQHALAHLIAEKPFGKITVQEIIDRANVGRTTFYAHFQSKEDLFISGHEGMITMIVNSFIASDGALRPEPSSEVFNFLSRIDLNRDTYYFLTRGSGMADVRQLLQERIAERLAARLGECYREEDCAIPFKVLAQNVGASMMTLINWWMVKRTPYSAQEMTAMLHSMNYAVLKSVLVQENRE
jgi:AcrR family transcriptional regulator